MSGSELLGRHLVAAGVIAEDALDELLALQQRPLRFASLCYLMGVASEETLVRALAKQTGVPGVVLSRSVIDLSVAEALPRETAIESLVLPLRVEGSRAYCAVTRPEEAEEALRTVAFVTGRSVVPYIALEVVLARLIRDAYSARDDGHREFQGEQTSVQQTEEGLHIWVVSDVETVPPGEFDPATVEAALDPLSMEVSVVDLDRVVEDLAELYEEPGDTTNLPTNVGVAHDAITGTGKGTEPTSPSLADVEFDPGAELAAIDLDATDTDADPHSAERESGDAPRVLVVDDDFATRNLLVKELAPFGYKILTAGTGGEAVKVLKANPPDAVITDVMLPQIDGFQICRAVKQSTKYGHIPVVLMSAVIDSGRVTPKVLRQYGADAYFEKPLNTKKLLAEIQSLLAAADGAQQAEEDGSFDRAVELYQAGDLEGAVAALREGIAIDPLSGRHHFLLGNLLQKTGDVFEAIDEYEVAVELMPTYFPAMTRLAYLYYKKGYAAKAIEVWRSSLRYCADAKLRSNIEVFMRKLIVDMQNELSKP